MTYTNSYINHVYDNHIDLVNLYSKASTFHDPIVKTIETASKYAVVAAGHLVLTLSLSITPITIALDIIDTLGTLFGKLGNGQINNGQFFGFILTPLAISALYYYGFTYEFIRNSNIERDLIYNPYLDINNPIIAESYNQLAHNHRMGMIAISIFWAGIGIALILALTDCDFFNKSFDNLLKISKIATGALCPPLALNQ